MLRFVRRYNEPWRSILEHWAWTTVVSVVLPLGAAGVAVVAGLLQLNLGIAANLLASLVMPVIIAVSFVGWCMQLTFGQESMDQWYTVPALTLTYVSALPITLTLLVTLPMWIGAFMCRGRFSRSHRKATNKGATTVDLQRSRMIPELFALGISCAVAVAAAGALAVGYVNWGLDARRGDFDYDGATLTFSTILIYSLGPFVLMILHRRTVRRAVGPMHRGPWNPVSGNQP